MSELNEWDVTDKAGRVHRVKPATDQKDMNWKVRYGKNGWKYFATKKSVREHYGEK